MEENTLSNEEIQRLRSIGLLTEQEVAARQGDLIVAINVVTQQRRIIEAGNVSEGAVQKRLLKG